MKFVTDTHCLIWYFQDDPRLDGRERELLETARDGQVVIPAIVLAELLCVSRKVKGLPPFAKTLERIEQCRTFTVAALDASIIKVAAELAKMEMHDALIVATALTLGVPLLTRDGEIIRSHAVKLA